MSQDIREEEPASPCIGVCAMNESTGLCAGCFRTLEEISQWWDMNASEKRDVVARLEQRQQALVNFD